MPSFYQDAKNGDLLQFRIRVLNSWGQYSDYLTIPAIKVKGNQMWIKVNGSWVEADCFFKVNGNWVEATPYVKINGEWKESS